MQKLQPPPQQPWTDQPEPQQCPQKKPHHMVQPDQPVGRNQQKPQQTPKQRGAEQQIPEPGCPPGQQPPGASQQIIDRRHGDSQQSGVEKPQTLGADRKLHQPKSLAQNPPAAGASS